MKPRPPSCLRCCVCVLAGPCHLDVSRPLGSCKDRLSELDPHPQA